MTCKWCVTSAALTLVAMIGTAVHLHYYVTAKHSDTGLVVVSLILWLLSPVTSYIAHAIGSTRGVRISGLPGVIAAVFLAAQGMVVLLSTGKVTEPGVKVAEVISWTFYLLPAAAGTSLAAGVLLLVHPVVGEGRYICPPLFPTTMTTTNAHASSTTNRHASPLASIAFI